MWWSDGWMMGWGWVLGGLIMTGFVLVVVALVVLMSRSRDGGASPPDRTEPRTAQQILDERYARGEIGTDEYHERSRALGRS